MELKGIFTGGNGVPGVVANTQGRAQRWAARDRVYGSTRGGRNQHVQISKLYYSQKQTVQICKTIQNQNQHKKLYRPKTKFINNSTLCQSYIDSIQLQITIKLNLIANTNQAQLNQICISSMNGTDGCEVCAEDVCLKMKTNKNKLYN